MTHERHRSRTEWRHTPKDVCEDLLLDVHQVAKTIGCSPRHVHRLSDAGRMPPPVKLGRLVRWRRCEIEAWIAEGCPPVRRKGGGR